MTGPADPAAARREAEEALKAHDVAVAGDEWAFAPISLDVADALRDLLAEPQEPVPDAVVREALRASAPDAVREAAEHYVGTCAETNGGKMCPRCLAVVLGIAARDGGGE